MPVPFLTKRIAFLTLPPVRELDLVGAVDVFTSANRAVGGKPLYDIKVINAEKSRADGKIAGMCGLCFHCDSDVRRFRGEIDTLLIPGGIGVEERTADASAVRWLQGTASQVRRIGSICTGAFLLAQAGLLDGRRVTTHWAFAAELAKRHPKVKVVPDPIWIQDDNFYTSAGVTAGIDLSLALLEEDHGAALALEVARMLVVFLRRPGDQAQFSVSLGAQSIERKPLHELRVWDGGTSHGRSFRSRAGATRGHESAQFSTHLRQRNGQVAGTLCRRVAPGNGATPPGTHDRKHGRNCRPMRLRELRCICSRLYPYPTPDAWGLPQPFQILGHWEIGLARICEAIMQPSE